MCRNFTTYFIRGDYEREKNLAVLRNVHIFWEDFKDLELVKLKFQSYELNQFGYVI